jgi:hypothetical protein
MVGGEKSFYESGNDRDSRLASLVRTIVNEPGGFEWISRFVPYLRKEANMRTAPIVIAAEAAHAKLKSGRAAGGEYTVRKLVASCIGRADEFAEFIGYWRMEFGRTLPGGVQRGLADAFSATINEYTALKYDGENRPIRLGDVVEILHPTPSDPIQSDLFRYLLDRRHHPKAVRVNLDRLSMVKYRNWMYSLSPEKRNIAAASGNFSEVLGDAGMTWENVSSYLGRELNAHDWEALIPNMGYMALLRNLRNFDSAMVPDRVAEKVASRLCDPEQVRRSKQFPYRFYTAYRNTKSTFRWAHALSKALDLSTENIPVLDGRTLVLVDTSGSMQAPVSQRSSVQYVDVAALFASAVEARNRGRVDVVAFATEAMPVTFPNPNVLANVDMIRAGVGEVGYGTNVMSGVKYFSGHDRIVIFSDMQDVGGYVMRGWLRGVPDVVTYSFNLAGHKVGYVNPENPNKYILSGFSDSAFKMMSMVERGKDQDWPF